MDLINIVFPISNVKLVDPAVFLLSWIKLLSCSNAFSWPMPPVDRFEVPKLISNPLNLVSLYRKSVDELKT